MVSRVGCRREEKRTSGNYLYIYFFSYLLFTMVVKDTVIARLDVSFKTQRIGIVASTIFPFIRVVGPN